MQTRLFIGSGLDLFAKRTERICILAPSVWGSGMSQRENWSILASVLDANHAPWLCL